MITPFFGQRLNQQRPGTTSGGIPGKAPQQRVIMERQRSLKTWPAIWHSLSMVGGFYGILIEYLW